MSYTQDDPWTLFWQSDHIESCIASGQAGDRLEIGEFWARFARSLAPGAEVLDLATGNGSVPLQLRRARDDLQITGVDRAAIDPMRYLSTAPELAGIEFRGGIDIVALPFAEDCFDAVTSQFGLEYAPRRPAVAELARVLRPGGRVCLLLHHVDSEILQPSHKLVQEIDSLLAPGGVLANLARYVRNLEDAVALERSGQRYLKSGVQKTKRISGQIFAGVDRVIKLQRSEPATAAMLAAEMERRLAAERARLQQLAAAALTPDEIEALAEDLRAGGLKVCDPEVLTVGAAAGDSALLGWQLLAGPG